MWNGFWAGVVAGYGVAVPVGAIGVLIIGLSARASPRVGVGAALGAATADALYAAAAVLGGAALAARIAPAAGVVRALAAVVLLMLAARTAYTAWRDHAVARASVRSRTDISTPARAGLTTPARAYLAVLALTVLNPATVVYFAALVVGRDAGDADATTGALFVAGAAVASASWQLLLAAGGALVGRALAGPRGRLATGLVSAAVVGGLGLSMLR